MYIILSENKKALDKRPKRYINPNLYENIYINIINNLLIIYLLL